MTEAGHIAQDVQQRDSSPKNGRGICCQREWRASPSTDMEPRIHGSARSKESTAAPSHSGEVMTEIAAGSKGREQMLFVLSGASGLRFGEALGLEIDKHVSDDCSMLLIRQKVWNGRVQPFLKTENGVRDIDLHPDVAAMLKRFIGNRISGFVFCSKNGLPLLQSNVLRLSLHQLLKKLGQPKAGAHAFRRFRTTWLRKQHAPEDLIRFWLGCQQECRGRVQQVERRRGIPKESCGTGRDRFRASSGKNRSCTQSAPKPSLHQRSRNALTLKRKNGSPG